MPAQFTDIAVSLASGQKPMLVLLQQGGQLKDMFGGIGPAARALSGYIVGLVNPFTIAAAAVGALAFAMAHAESAARGLNTLQAQLAGTGRSGLFSTDELKGFLKELQLAPGVSREAATKIVAALATARDIGAGLFRDLAGSAADYAKATGTDIPTAAKALAEAFSDPAKGAKQLDEALNGALSSGQVLLIERLTKTGEVAKAQGVLFDALQARIKGLADNSMTPLQKSVNDLGNSWEGAMRKMDQSDGLRTLNTLLGKTVEFVAFLVNNADKIGGLGNIGAAAVPGVGPALAVSNLVTNAVGGPLFGSAPNKNPTASGKVTDLTAEGAKAAAAAAAGGDAEIKRALEAAKAYKGQAFELQELGLERKRFNSALTQSIDLYGKESEQAKRLRAAIAGVDEKMDAIRKRGAGNEAQQVLKEQLAGRLDAISAAFQRERDALAFNNRFLEGEYRAGAIALVGFYDQKRRNTAAGIAAEIAELENKKGEINAALDATGKERITDPSERLKLGRDIDKLTAQQEQIRTKAAQEASLANQEESASFKQLSEQVLNYRANLLDLQGDEVGAARIRAQIAIEQARILSKQAGGSDVDVGSLERGLAQQVAITDAKTKTSAINQILQIEEERIALAQRTGAAGEIAALIQLGAARSMRVADLEKELQALERLAKDRPLDIPLQLDTSRARLELDKLKAELDPLKEKFDNLFKDAGANFLTDLMGAKGIRGALKGFADSVGREINSMVGKELSGSLFGKSGTLGGVGGLFARLFGGGQTALANSAQEGFRTSEILAQNAAGATAASSAAALASAETAAGAAISAASSSSAAALASLTAAAQAAAAALSSISASSGAGGLGSLLGAGGAVNTGATFSAETALLFGWATGGYTGRKDPEKVAGVVHGDEYVFSSQAVRAIGVDRLEQLHKKAKSGHMQEEDLPGYSDGGYVTTLSSVQPQTMRRGDAQGNSRAAVNNVYHITVALPPGATRQTGAQAGAEVRRALEKSGRNL